MASSAGEALETLAELCLQCELPQQMAFEVSIKCAVAMVIKLIKLLQLTALVKVGVTAWLPRNRQVPKPHVRDCETTTTAARAKPHFGPAGSEELCRFGAE
jgi:hypothetical protein